MAKAKVFTVEREAAVNLFVALGIPTAAKWTDERLAEKLQKLDVLCEDEEERSKVTDKAAQKTMKAILAALDNDVTIELEAGEADDDKPAKKAAKAAADEDEEEEEEEEDKPKSSKKDKKVPVKPAKKAAKKKGERKKGSCYYIIEMLKAATEEKPTSVDKITKELVKRFPGQAEPSMRNTVKGAFNWMPFCEGLVVSRDADGGLWVSGKCEKGTKATDIPRGKIHKNEKGSKSKEKAAAKASKKEADDKPASKSNSKKAVAKKGGKKKAAKSSK